jgi:TRAP-type mannitol/chloroaromatic compound transport system substrate-binding protein
MSTSRGRSGTRCPTRKAILEQACGDLVRETIAEGEASQFREIREMQEKNGVQVHRWSPEIMAAMEKAWIEVIAEEAAKNPNFKKVWDSYAKFRADYAVWRDYGYLK